MVHAVMHVRYPPPAYVWITFRSRITEWYVLDHHVPSWRGRGRAARFHHQKPAGEGSGAGAALQGALELGDIIFGLLFLY